MSRDQFRVRGKRRPQHALMKVRPVKWRPKLPCDGTFSIVAVATQVAEVDATAQHEGRDEQRGKKLPLWLTEPGYLLQDVRLILDSRVLCDQQLNERMKQRFAPFSDIVHKLEETEVEREFLLGNAPMGAQPTPQQRPEALHRIHMDFTKAVTIFISGVLALSMVHTLMLVSPCTQA